MDHIILFQHAHFHGQHKHVFRKEANLNASDDNFFNDKVSSIAVFDGKWAFYRHANFKIKYPNILGRGLYQWVRDVGITNDDMSSLRPVSAGATQTGSSIDRHVVLFQHAHFHGQHKHVFREEANLNASDDNFFNDKVSSIAVLDGKWAFYRHANFKIKYPNILDRGLYSWVVNVGITNDDMSSLEPSKLEGNFEGRMTFRIDDNRFPGPFYKDFNLTLKFSPDLHDVRLAFPKIKIGPFQTPIGENTITVTQTGGGSGSFDQNSGNMEIPIDLYFDHSTIFAGNSDLSFLLTTGISSSPTGRLYLIGRPWDQKNNIITLVGASHFRGGFLDKTDCSIETHGILTLP